MVAYRPMPVQLTIQAGSFPVALQTFRNKMSTLCPGMPYEFVVECEPTSPSATPPPWVFNFVATVTVIASSD